MLNKNIINVKYKCIKEVYINPNKRERDGGIMIYNNLVLEKQSNIALVKFDRPKSLNALNSQMLAEIDHLIDELQEDNQVSVIVFTGEGKSFIAGADISQMAELSGLEARDFGAFGQRVFEKIENISKPTIAAVNGFALGGGLELAMSCDIRYASSKAKFGQPEVGLGITPGFSGTQRLPKIVGLSKAKELIFTGEMIDANEALNIKLVTRVFEPDLLIDEALGLASKIASNAQIAVRLSKRALNEGYNKDIKTGTNLEALYFGMCFSTEDQKNGMKAFLNKEKANFKGK